jgi:hypothetical protein
MYSIQIEDNFFHFNDEPNPNFELKLEMIIKESASTDIMINQNTFGTFFFVVEFIYTFSLSIS